MLNRAGGDSRLFRYAILPRILPTCPTSSPVSRLPASLSLRTARVDTRRRSTIGCCHRKLWSTVRDQGLSARSVASANHCSISIGQELVGSSIRRGKWRLSTAVSTDRAVRGSTSGSKVQRSFEATAHWQVVGRSCRWGFERAISAMDRLPVIGQEISLNGSFPIS